MELPLGIVLNGIDKFLLILVRMTGLFVISPVFGRRNLPAYFKTGLSVLLSLIMVNIAEIDDQAYYSSFLQFGFIIVKELLVGITIGFVSYMFFSAIYLAGEIIDTQIGFGMVNILDPMSNIQVPITSNLYFITCILVFLAVNGHHALIKALFDSYSIIPVGGAVFGENLMNDVVELFGNLFVIGFKIAAPVTATMLIADIALGVVSKTIPQLNVFIVGMPLKIMLGIAVLMITIPMFVFLLDGIFMGMNDEMFNFMRDMKPK